MALTPKQINDVLRTVDDPELHRDLVTLGMIKEVSVDGADVYVEVQLTTPACPMKEQIHNDVENAIRAKAQELGEEIGTIDIELTAEVERIGEQPEEAPHPLPGVKHIIAIGAGKGGVGKSMVSVNVAVGLARQGAKVGLLDADIYGPSLTTMLGLADLQSRADENMLVPFEVFGIKAITIGKLVPHDQALIWRGPMAHGAFSQLATKTAWGELDYLIVDLPPGTGDVPLTLTQILPLTGAVIVCTPQKVAQDDAVRAVQMFRELGVDVLGIVENMSYFIGDDGKEYDIFGRGGAQRMAETAGLPFLGAIPINTDLRHNCDAGNPAANWEGEAALANELDHVVQTLAAQVSIAEMSGGAPTLSIS